MPRRTIQESHINEPLIVSAKADPPTESWWVRGAHDRAAFCEAHAAQLPRLTTERLPVNLQRGLERDELARLEAERRQVIRR